MMLLVSTCAAGDHSGAANTGACGFGPAGPVGDAPSLDVNHGLGKVDEVLGPICLWLGRRILLSWDKIRCADRAAVIGARLPTLRKVRL